MSPGTRGAWARKPTADVAPSAKARSGRSVACSPPETWDCKPYPGPQRRLERIVEGTEIHGNFANGGEARRERAAGRPGPARARVLPAHTRPGRSRAAGELRHQRASRLVAARL